MAKKPCILVIRDGWGINPAGGSQAAKNGDATLLTDTPFHDYLFDNQRLVVQVTLPFHFDITKENNEPEGGNEDCLSRDLAPQQIDKERLCLVSMPHIDNQKTRQNQDRLQRGQRPENIGIEMVTSFVDILDCHIVWTNRHFQISFVINY